MTIRNFLHLLDENAERWLLLPLYAMIVITIFMEVFRRFALSYSSIWAEEIARYAFIYVSWIGASAAIKERAHIRIDLILPVVGERTRAVIMILGDLVTIVLAVLAFWWSLESVLVSLKFGSVTHGLRISLAWFLAAVPFGFALMLYRLIQSIIRDVSDLRAGRPIYRGKKLFD
ncbi:MAG: TRAP transporter small permease [Desulfobacterales bacterium]|nr:TRAP transporter small permease [Desulfobacterales bacterium]